MLTVPLPPHENQSLVCPLSCTIVCEYVCIYVYVCEYSNTKSYLISWAGSRSNLKSYHLTVP